MKFSIDLPSFSSNDEGNSIYQDLTLKTVSINANGEENIEELPLANGKKHKDRESWGKGIEFLFSCIAMSVGLGNIWRFPFIALENGGGAFVIPYLIVLLLIGKPGYFLEMVMGQFSSRGPVKIFDCVPAMRGVGIGQTMIAVSVSTYYSSVMAVTLRYLYFSFSSVLPWSICNQAWNVSCYPAYETDRNFSVNSLNGTKSSTELYFTHEVYHAKSDISDGIGSQNWDLVGFLALTWILVFFVLMKGIKVSGKASYITGIAPFIFLIIFLIRAVTLPGAWNGIAYFFTPNFKELLKPKVWFAACTQVFFSLNVFCANLIMYASYNKFNHKIYRDSNIITSLDTFTSLLAGCVTFGIVGHLAHELGVENIADVVKSGPGLVFITYAETISKFKFLPQLFSILFFFMLFILGMGSLFAMTSSVITVIREQFNFVKNWQAALGYSIFGVIFGSLYTTSGGQSVLTLVDHYGAQCVMFLLAIFEIYTFCYIYGVNRICKDVKFMLGFRPSIFWRSCWYVVTPAIMTIIVGNTLLNYENPKDNDNVDFPVIAHIFGWILTSFSLIWLPILLIMRIIKQDEGLWTKRIAAAFYPTKNWGPLDPELNKKYKDYLKECDLNEEE